MLNPLLSICRVCVQEWPTDTHCGSAKRYSLDNIGSSPDTTVYEKLELLVGKLQAPPLTELVDHFHQNFDARPSKIQLPTSMVGEYNTSQTEIVCFQGVLGRRD